MRCCGVYASGSYRRWICRVGASGSLTIPVSRRRGSTRWAWRGNTLACWESKTTAKLRSVSPWQPSRRAFRWPIGCICARIGQRIRCGARRQGFPRRCFATKPQIALEQLETLLAQGAPKYCVLADAAYGLNQAFRQRLTDLGLLYVVGITSAVVVWPPGLELLPPKRYSGTGRPPVMPRRTDRRQPVSVKDLAHGLPPGAFRSIRWREGSNQTLTGRFAAVRVRRAGGNIGKARLQPEQWLLIEWPQDDAEPLKYYLSNLPEKITLNDLVAQAQMRWRIERDSRDLKQELGLGQYEGRGGRGFHHHARLSTAAYGCLVSARLAAGKPGGAKKNFVTRQIAALPEDYIPRGSPARTTPRSRFNYHDPLPSQLSTDSAPRTVSLLRSKT